MNCMAWNIVASMQSKCIQFQAQNKMKRQHRQKYTVSVDWERRWKRWLGFWKFCVETCAATEYSSFFFLNMWKKLNEEYQARAKGARKRKSSNAIMWSAPVNYEKWIFPHIEVIRINVSTIFSKAINMHLREGKNWYFLKNSLEFC